MSEEIDLWGRVVWRSEEFRPAANVLPPLVGRHREMGRITAAWMAGEKTLPMAPLLVGEPGVGKNRLVYELAKWTGRKLYIFQGHEDVTAEDLACSVRFSDSVERKMDYVISPLVTAMHYSGICFIDEIGKIRPRALALLVSVLDERRYIDSSLLAERIPAHPHFRFIAATNTGEVNALPEFIRSRMRPVIHISPPQPGEINSIIRKQFQNINRLPELLELFWALWGKRSKDTPPTPRDAIHLFALATSLGDFDRLGGEGRFAKKQEDDPLVGAVGAIDIETRHLELAFEELFHGNPV